MASSQLIVSGQRNVADNTTRYIPIVGGISGNANAEDTHSIPIREAGTLRNLFVYVPANTASVVTDIIVRKSLANTSITVSYSADQTGIKEDTSNTATVASSDECAIQVAVPTEVGTNNITITMMGLEFVPDAAGNCVVPVGPTGFEDLMASPSSTLYYPPGGYTSQETAGEADAKWRCRGSFTMSNLYTWVRTNARTTDTTIRTRKNGANGGQSVTYSAGQTGAKEDTTNSDSLVAGDDFNYSLTSGTGSETMNLSFMSCKCLSTNSEFPMIAGHGGGVGVAVSSTAYFGIAGPIDPAQSAEASAQIYPRFTFTIKELTAYASANTMTTGTTDVTVRDNGADSILSVSYAVGQTGLKTDSDEVVVTSGADEINYEVTNSDAAGVVTLHSISTLGTTAAGGQPTCRRMGAICHGRPMLIGEEGILVH